MTLCLGGTFNPVHVAHLSCSAEAARQAGFSEVALIPNHISPHKLDSKDNVDPIHRINMLLLAIESHATSDIGFRIETIEINRGGPSYTFDTATQLIKMGWPKINWLIGADQLVNLHRWHAYPQLLENVQFWVMARPGHDIDWDKIDPLARNLKNHVVTVPQLPISSTSIRDIVRKKGDITGLVEPSVREYILQHHLYL